MLTLEIKKIKKNYYFKLKNTFTNTPYTTLSNICLILNY